MSVLATSKAGHRAPALVVLQLNAFHSILFSCPHVGHAVISLITAIYHGCMVTAASAKPRSARKR